MNILEQVSDQSAVLLSGTEIILITTKIIIELHKQLQLCTWTWSNMLWVSLSYEIWFSQNSIKI